jgi:hypothetical protein
MTPEIPAKAPTLGTMEEYRLAFANLRTSNFGIPSLPAGWKG